MAGLVCLCQGRGRLGLQTPRATNLPVTTSYDLRPRKARWAQTKLTRMQGEKNE